MSEKKLKFWKVVKKGCHTLKDGKPHEIPVGTVFKAANPPNAFVSKCVEVDTAGIEEAEAEAESKAEVKEEAKADTKADKAKK